MDITKITIDQIEGQEFFNEVKDKYPCLKPDVRIHKWPGENNNAAFGYLEERNMSNVFDYGTMTKLNDNGITLLKYCDGRKNTVAIIDEIINDLDNAEKISEEDKLTIIKKIAKFLATAKNVYKHIDFLDNPANNNVVLKETGNKEFFIPVHFVLEITNQCNLSCKHCYRFGNKNYPIHKLSFEEVKNIIDTFYENGASVVELTGGEITLHKNFVEIVEYLYDKMDMIGLLTNGYSLTDEMIERLTPLRNKLLWSVSLDSYDPEFHDSFRGVKGCHARISHAVQKLTENGHRVRVAMSVIDENVDHLKPTMDYVYHTLKARHFGFSSVMPFGRGEKIHYQLTPHVFADLKKYADERYPEDFIAWISHESLVKTVHTSNNCGAGWKSVTIDPQGNVRPCVMMEEAFINLGNIREKSILEIMNQEDTKHMADHEMPMAETCEKDCKDLNFCMYCIYRAILTNEKRKEDGMEYCAWYKRNVENKLTITKYEDAACVLKDCFKGT